MTLSISPDRWTCEIPLQCPWCCGTSWSIFVDDYGTVTRAECAGYDDLRNPCGFSFGVAVANGESPGKGGDVLFNVTRTSYFSGEKPCSEAVLIDSVRPDRRDTDKNHRVENGGICRDFDDKKWVVELGGLEDIKKLVDKYGDVIISTDREGEYHIEIYDDFR